MGIFMAVTFDLAFQRTIGHEGGFSIDKNDPGNWTGGKVGVGTLKGTKFGIASNTYPNLDIKNLTIQQAKVIYKRDWWDKMPTTIHSAIVFQLWDFAINAGLNRAVRALQAAAGTTVDGAIGPKTIQAVNSMDVHAVIFKLNAERLKHYTSLKNWSKYGGGWANRVAQNLMYAAIDV